MIIQSVLFRKPLWTEDDARRWLKKHGYVYNGKVHKTDSLLRFRQIEPKGLEGWKSIEIGYGIVLVVAD
jgi:hypothetical protein